MPEYIEFPLDTNPEVLAEDAFDYIQAKFPGWVPNDGNLDTIMIEVGARLSAEARDVASLVPVEIFRYFGGLVGIDPTEAVSASAETTWTMIDNAGYTIPGGTQVGIRIAGDVLAPFITIVDTVIPSGSTVANNVLITAVEPGGEFSSIGVAAGEVELIDTLDFVLTITQEAPTAGGIDEEDEEDYLDRLRERLQLLAPRPILARDFAIMAEDISGVDRAIAIDGYNPADTTENNERMVAVAAVDEDGEAVSGPIKSEIDAYLQAHREINFIVNVFDPTYSDVDVTFAAVALPGFDPAVVEVSAEAAVTEYLSPKNWGLVTSGFGDSPESQNWINQKILRYLELAQVINQVQGINYITSLTFRVPPAAFASTDVTLTGAVPLPRPGTISGTVSAP
jgi:hypothetical protein